jgi:branched-chain amino acid transport system substrate-binding protein
MGMEVVGSWRPSPSASDLRAETAAIRASGANMIYTVFTGAGGIVFGKQLAELKVPAIVAGSPATPGLPGQGIEYSVAMMSAATVRIKITDKNIAWYDEFLKRSKGELNFISAYDAIMGLAASIEKVGSLDANALVKAMETQEYSGIVGVKKYDPKDHRTVYSKGYRAVYGIQQLPNYKYAVVWPTDAAVKAQPVQIPQWMIDAWKKAK